MPTINTVRIIRHSTDVMEKEVLKEYFRYLGLLFYDAPINTSTDFTEELLNSRHKADVDIILNCSEELAWIPADYLNEVQDSTILIKTEEKQGQNRSFSINRGQINLFQDGSEYYHTLIAQLLDAIFDSRKKTYASQKDLEQSMKAQMCEFLNDMYDYYLFAFMQNKHTFRILNMGTVIDGVFIDGVNTRPYISSGDDVSGQFNTMMLKKLVEVNHRLGNPETLSGKNYLLYAKANTIRKAKEIVSLMQEPPAIDGLKDTIGLSFSDHLDLIKKIEATASEKKMHIGTLFLGATICQETENHQSRAEDYYQKLIIYASSYPSGKTPVFYSFFYYQYGRFLARVWHNYEYAKICYEVAANLDSRGYQANFMLGAYHEQRKHIAEAQRYLQEALKILYCGQIQENIYNCLSIKAIPYVFKTCFLLARISALSGRIQERSYYLWSEEDSFGAFVDIVNTIKQNYCLADDIKGNAEGKQITTLFEQWDKAHRDGTPIRVLKNVMYISREILSQR